LATISTANVNIVEAKTLLERSAELEVLDWLTPIDYGTRHSHYYQRHQPGTGQWFIDSTEFQTWLSVSNQTMFCPGIPGDGKTTLSSILIEHLHSRFAKDSDVGIAYIYCNFRRQNEQNINDLLASLLKQLAMFRSSLGDDIKALYRRHLTRKTRPSLDELSEALQSAVRSYSRVFVVVDALDECEVKDRSKLLTELCQLQADHEINILATSRFIPNITENFSGSLTLEIRATKPDVRSYLLGNVLDLPHFVSERPGLLEEIVSMITDAVGGMYDCEIPSDLPRVADIYTGSC
jgi:Cdc6-like AAA superfamily ATPase